MCSTMGERYPVVFEWRAVRHEDDVSERRLCEVLAGASGGVVTLADGVVAYAAGPVASAAALIVQAARDACVDGMTVGGHAFASPMIRRGVTWFEKRVAMGPVLPWQPQSPFGPGPYPWG